MVATGAAEVTESSSPANVPTTAPKFSLGGMIRLTLPAVSGELSRSKATLAILLLLSFLLGFVPAIKSELESGIIDQIDHEIQEAPRGRFLDVLQVDVERFAIRADQGNMEIPERLTYILVGSRRMSLLGALIYYALVTVVAFFFLRWSTSLRSRLRLKLFTRLRSAGLKNALGSEGSQADGVSNSPANQSMAIQQGATNVADAYDYMIESGQLLFALFTTLFLVVTKSWPFGLACLVLVAIQAPLSWLQAHRLANKRSILDAKRNDLVARSDDILQKRELILAYDQGPNYRDKLNQLAGTYGGIERELGVSEATYSGISTILIDSGRIGILVAALAIAVKTGGSSIANIGDVYFLIAIYARLSFPMTALLSRYDSTMKARSTSNTFLSLIENGQSSDGNEAVKPFNEATESSSDAAVTFTGVSFRYALNESGSVVQDCTFMVPTHRTTLLVGRSGIGKTTIARLTMGFLRPTAGTVRVGGVRLEDWEPEDLRLTLSYVSQGDFIIDETIRENLGWAHRAQGGVLTDELMLEALDNLGIAGAADVDILNRRARELSFGQQQRLSLARMMLDQSDLMILDEPLAGLDVFTLSELHEPLRRFFGDGARTVMMFSHKLSFAAFADQVVVLGEHAGVEEQGTPQDLMKAGGTFARLYSTALRELEVRPAPA